MKASKGMKKKTMVLYPGLSVSHLVPMMKLADALVEEGYAVTVVLVDPSLKQDIALGAVVDRIVSSSKPSVTFHKLPRIQDPPAIVHDEKFLVRYYNLMSRCAELLHDYLCSTPPSSVHALVADFASSGALHVSKNLGIPAYSFVPINASAFSVFSQLPSIRTEGKPTMKDLGDTPLSFHGVPPIPASHINTENLEDPESEKVLLDGMVAIQEQAKGILINTLLSLEAPAVGALGDRRRFPAMPPVYCVGPWVADAEASLTGEEHECLSWLDEQPDRSVVYLCFGSVGAGHHSEEQLKEIAVGLEKSGHRFLWVVRAPPHRDPERPFDPRADPDLDAVLPEGFLERTDGRGLVVKLWAPQVQVLRHRAAGAFVTHCGWNSVLEGITAGVPMLCWPLYSEQKMNKVVMVEEMGIGVEMLGWKQGLVRAEEVEAKVRLVMESEEGEQLRARMAVHKEAADMAWKAGGSSRAAFGDFLLDAGRQTQPQASTPLNEVLVTSHS